MRITLFLCLSVASLTRAAFWDAESVRDSRGEEGHKWVMTPEMLAHGITEGQTGILNLRGKLDGLVDKILTAGKTDNVWLDIMKEMAQFMKGGKKMYEDHLVGLMILAHKMFENEHGFREVTRCNSLSKSMDHPDYGKKEFMPAIAVALGKDLICFDNLLKDMTVSNLRTDPACEPSEDDVVDLIAYASKELFRMKNDGLHFYETVTAVLEKYDGTLHKAFTDEFGSREVSLEKLIRALKSKN